MYKIYLLKRGRKVAGPFVGAISVGIQTFAINLRVKESYN